MSPVCKKQPARKQTFVPTPNSHSAFKNRVNKFQAQKPRTFLLHFLFGRDHNHFNFISKIMKICEQILKKDSAPDRKIKFFN